MRNAHRVATADDIAALRLHIAMERDAHLREDSEAIVRLSGEFHMLIARLADAELLTKILRMLTIRTSLITAMYQARATQTCGPDEHERIVSAIENRDETRACAEVAAHLDHLETALRLSELSVPVSHLQDALSDQILRRHAAPVPAKTRA